MSYEVALFDLDSTLFDSALSEKLALEASFEHYAVSLTDEFLSQYKIINTQLWLDFEQGTISLDQLRVERFSRLCRKLNLTIRPHELADLYEGNLGISGKALCWGYGVACADQTNGKNWLDNKWSRVCSEGTLKTFQSLPVF